MNVVVLVKQVPDTESLIEINATADDIKTDNLKWIMNPYDELAVEEAIRIKEKQGNGKVTVLSVGAERAAAAIRTALAMGADEGLLISDPALGKTDAILTAKVLAAALKTIPFFGANENGPTFANQKDPTRMAVGLTPAADDFI